VIIGAVSIHGEMAPKLITEKMVKKMKPKSVIIDASIDQGGCVETIHPTNWANATYVAHGVTHFGVPNMPSNISRTATYALSNAILPYVFRMAQDGLEKVMQQDYGVARGVYTYKGEPLRNVVAKRMGMTATPLKNILKGGGK
jgi:alanine dehydrogenase